MNQREEALSSVKQFKNIVEKMDDLISSIQLTQQNIANELLKISNLDQAALSIDQHLTETRKDANATLSTMTSAIDEAKHHVFEMKTTYDVHLETLKKHQSDMIENIQKNSQISNQKIEEGISKLSDEIHHFIDILEKIDQQNKQIDELKSVIQINDVQLRENIDQNIRQLIDEVHQFIDIIQKIDQQNQLIEELKNSNQKNQKLIIILVITSIIIGLLGIII
jgi:hypothetical protein